jgi:hypothetical protein
MHSVGLNSSHPPLVTTTKLEVKENLLPVQKHVENIVSATGELRQFTKTLEKARRHVKVNQEIPDPSVLKNTLDKAGLSMVALKPLIKDSPLSAGMPKLLNMNGDLSSVFTAIDELMKVLNVLQTANSSLEEIYSQKEVSMNQTLDAAEKSQTDTFETTGIHNNLYQLTHADSKDPNAVPEDSAKYQADLSKNQQDTKQVDANFQQWQAVTNQNNTNITNLMGVGSPILQYLSNFLSHIHN